jgi:SAM-dependent methyltransferase
MADASVDVALLIDVLHHTDDPRPLLAECARVTRQAVIVKDHLREGLAAGPTLRFMDWMGNAGHGVRLPYAYLTHAQWNAVFGKTGLRAAWWEERLRLYPPAADWLFGRRLHFVAKLVPVVS